MCWKEDSGDVQSQPLETLGMPNLNRVVEQPAASRMTCRQRLDELVGRSSIMFEMVESNCKIAKKILADAKAELEKFNLPGNIRATLGSGNVAPISLWDDIVKEVIEYNAKHQQNILPYTRALKDYIDAFKLGLRSYPRLQDVIKNLNIAESFATKYGSD
ncbi:uncharacterized protein LOC118435502 isoform X2 [Folsomia candida]|uniref:uncharacterized protein LOC118435502 isoform X2 n=1 Tax=Folsomia candida TaxID=158441 RepID=UPI00160559C8|nr:uncharacterized protein LOC118435502 isoform X2 [Folsomia candida]